MSDDNTAAHRAVAKYEEAKKQLDEFLEDETIRDLMLEYQMLIEQYNREADSAVRAVKSELQTRDSSQLVIGDIGAQKKVSRWYDATHLVNTLPAAQTDLFMKEEVVYKIDKNRLDQLLRQGEIDEQIVADAYHEDEKSPSAMPGCPKPYSIPKIITE
jgi:hypothetical protein